MYILGEVGIGNRRKAESVFVGFGQGNALADIAGDWRRTIHHGERTVIFTFDNDFAASLVLVEHGMVIRRVMFRNHKRRIQDNLNALQRSLLTSENTGRGAACAALRIRRNRLTYLMEITR